MEESITEKVLDRAVRVAQLLDIYGSLLTEKQRTFVELHYGKDLSFGEIAREHNVSRQAVHDAVKHAETTLEEYESNLRLLGKGSKQNVPAWAADRDESSSEKTDMLVNHLNGLRKNIQRHGIIYNSGWIIAEIDKMLKML